MAVIAGSALLVGVLVWVMFSPTKSLDTDVVIQSQLRSAQVALLQFGFDHNEYLPGLAPDGSLLNNDPASRYRMLTDPGYLEPALLVSPNDARPNAVYSYALLDLSEPGSRRDAWTIASAPNAPVMAESLASHGDPEVWSGWVLWHSLSIEAAAFTTEHLASPEVRTRYTDSGDFNEQDDLFGAEGPDDAYLIETQH